MSRRASTQYDLSPWSLSSLHGFKNCYIMQQMWAATSYAYDLIFYLTLRTKVSWMSQETSPLVCRGMHTPLLPIASVTSQSLCQAVETMGALSSHSSLSKIQCCLVAWSRTAPLFYNPSLRGIGRQRSNKLMSKKNPIPKHTQRTSQISLAHRVVIIELCPHVQSLLLLFLVELFSDVMLVAKLLKECLYIFSL